MTWPIVDGTTGGSPLQDHINRAARGGIFTVADDTERDELLVELATAGIPLDADNPLYVHNQARLAGLETEYTTDGSAWYSAGGGVTRESFTSSGTWSKPAGLKSVGVHVLGGGGAGGGCWSTGSSEVADGGGGASGGYAYSLIPASSVPSSVAVTVGAGGAGTTANEAGGDGGSSSFGSLVEAPGGLGGSRGTAAINFTRTSGGGSRSSGFTLSGSGNSVIGSDGDNGVCAGSASLRQGTGGAAPGPFGGGTRRGTGGAGLSGSRYGGGGSGASSDGSNPSLAGGNGADGIVVVEMHF